jgi:hypothetical protein
MGENKMVTFKLMREPIDYQITVHVTNLLNTYPKNEVTQTFKAFLYNPEAMDKVHSGQTIKALITYYGVEKFRNWFTLIYGWEFKKVG